MSLFVTPRITIPEEELEEKFIRSSGPGGQNVNKVASAVQLRFDVRNSPSLTELARAALLFGGTLTRDGPVPPEGCAFRPRCPYAADACLEAPPLREVLPGRRSACPFAPWETW